MEVMTESARSDDNTPGRANGGSPGETIGRTEPENSARARLGAEKYLRGYRTKKEEREILQRANLRKNIVHSS